MSLFDTLLSGAVLGGLFLYATAILLVEWMAARLHVRDPHHGHILSDRFLLPLGRALAMSIFILAAYPQLFGTAEAMPLDLVLSAEAGQLNRLISLSLLLTLILPLLPVIGGRAVILPLQGMLLAAVLFGWMAAAEGYHGVVYWPGSGTVAALLFLSAMAPLAAARLAHHIGHRLDAIAERRGFQDLVYDGLLMTLQLPSLLIYTHALGEQLGR